MDIIHEHDEWNAGPNIVDADVLLQLHHVLEDSPIIVEHWFYRKGVSPERRIFEDYEDFKEYLDRHATPGDAFHIWRFDQLCRDDNTMAHGKFPDDTGRVPKGGAY